MLETAGENYIRLTQHYKNRRGIPDEEWGPEAGKNGWIVITADKRLWKRSVQRQMLFKYGVRAFIFTENVLRGDTRADILRRALPEIHQLVKEIEPPFIASLTTEGHVHLLFDTDTHKRALRGERRSARTRARRKQKKSAGR